MKQRRGKAWADANYAASIARLSTIYFPFLSSFLVVHFVVVHFVVVVVVILSLLKAGNYHSFIH